MNHKTIQRGVVANDNIDGFAIKQSDGDSWALSVTDGPAPEDSVVFAAPTKNRAITIQGNGGGYFVGRDYTNDIEFAMGTSVLGTAFAGSTTAHPFQLRYDNAVKLTAKAVGIGIMMEPVRPLDVSGAIGSTSTIYSVNYESSRAINSTMVSSTTANVTVFDTSAVAANVGGGISFTGKYTGDTYLAGAPFIKAYKENATADNYSFGLAFGTRLNAGPQSIKMVIDGAGVVGIGTSAPTTHGGYTNLIDLYGGGIAMQRAADTANLYAFATFNAANAVLSRVLQTNAAGGNVLAFYNDTASANIAFYQKDATTQAVRQQIYGDKITTTVPLVINGSAASGSLKVNGDSYLEGAVVVNEAGADKDFRVEGDTDANMLFVDASADRLGIGTSSLIAKVNFASTDTSLSGNSYLAYMASTVNPASTSTATHHGMRVEHTTSSACAQDVTALNSMRFYSGHAGTGTNAANYGIFGYCGTDGTGTITTVYSIYTRNYATSGRITTWYGTYINTPTLGSAVVTTATALYIASQVASGTRAATVATSGAVRLSNVVTITTTAAHRFITGDSVVIASVTYAGATAFNGTFTITGTPTTTSFTYAQAGEDGTGTGGTGTVTAIITNTPYAIYQAGTADINRFDGLTVFNETGTSTGDVRIEGDTDANLLFTDASADNVGIGTNAPTARLHIKAGSATASTAPLKFTSGAILATPEAGAMEFYDGRWYLTGTAKQRVIDRTCTPITSTTTVANTVTETTLFTETLSANAMKVGRIYKLHCDGVASNASAADDLTFNLYFGGTLIDTFSPTMGALPANSEWCNDCNITIRTTGASGTCAIHCDMEIGTFSHLTASLGSIDTTAAETLVLKVQWNNAKAGNTLSIYQGWLELKN